MGRPWCPLRREHVDSGGPGHRPLVYAEWYAESVAKTVPVREMRDTLAQLLDLVADRREHIVVTRRGRPAAVLIPVDEYEGLEETAELLSDPGAMESIEAGVAEVEKGETVSLDALRADLAGRRAGR